MANDSWIVFPKGRGVSHIVAETKIQIWNLPVWNAHQIKQAVNVIESI